MNRIKIICFAFTLIQISFIQVANAQSIRQSVIKSKPESIRPYMPPVSKTNSQQRKKVRYMEKQYNPNEYVLYREVIRKNSWLEGLGEPITKDVAKLLPYYYKFSLKNSAGHWQKVEALHGDMLTTNHPLGTYILSKNDEVDTIHKGWMQQLRRVGWWILVPDLSGENVIEERAYEARRDNADLIYSSQIVRIDEHHATISYNDSWGYPSDMNENGDYTYGSVVQITYNMNGLDSIIDYLDGAGYRKDNINGVGQERLSYDKKNRIIEHTSNNIVGDMAFDIWDNCGYKIEYDDKENSYTVTSIDQLGNPKRMHAIGSPLYKTYIRCKVYRDKWGRDIEAVILNENNENDTTLNGVHKFVYKYSVDGELRPVEYYDLNNKKIEIK